MFHESKISKQSASCPVKVDNSVNKLYLHIGFVDHFQALTTIQLKAHKCTNKAGQMMVDYQQLACSVLFIRVCSLQYHLVGVQLALEL